MGEAIHIYEQNIFEQKGSIGFGSAVKPKKSVRVVEIEMDHQNVLTTQVLNASTLA
jgi:hypothetical protein